MSGWVAGAVVGGAVLNAGASIYAANQQSSAAQNATNTQAGMYNATVGREAPFVQSGQEATGQLNYLLGLGTPGQGGTAGSAGAAGGFGSLNAPFTTDTFKSMSPAYQFQLQQGGQGVLNQASGAQGALSGSALKDLMSFNQQFANTSFNNAFNQYQTQQSNTFNRLNSIAGMGQAAASNQATGGSSYGASIGQTMSNVGTAQAGGTVGAANSLSSLSALPWLMNGDSGATMPAGADASVGTGTMPAGGGYTYTGF